MNDSDIELINIEYYKTAIKFKVGQQVKCISSPALSGGHLEVGKIYTIKKVKSAYYNIRDIRVNIEGKGQRWMFFACRFIPIEKFEKLRII